PAPWRDRRTARHAAHRRRAAGHPGRPAPEPGDAPGYPRPADRSTGSSGAARPPAPPNRPAPAAGRAHRRPPPPPAQRAPGPARLRHVLADGDRLRLLAAAFEDAVELFGLKEWSL